MSKIEEMAEKAFPYDTEYSDLDPILSGNDLMIGERNAYFNLLSFLDTLEEKGVDLKKEIDNYISSNFFGSQTMGFFANRTKEEPNDRDIALVAKHFFELGINTSNQLTWEDVKEICVQSVLVEIDLGGKVSDERHYTEVLKRFKALKGE